MTEPSGLPRIRLRKGADKRFKNGHSWVYSNEIDMDDAAKALAPGTVVQLLRSDKKEMGVGTFNPHTLISYRGFSRTGSRDISSKFIKDRLTRALELRNALFSEPYYRLVHGDADGLPGLVIDRFDDTLVIQTATAGMDNMLERVISVLEQTINPATIIIANDGAFRNLESLETYSKIAKGQVDGPIRVRENGLTFFADPLDGQKTGWFYDQRPNRAFVAGLAKGRTVLDLYSYAGGFGVTAAAKSAESVLMIDRSERALALARQAAEANGVAEACQFSATEVFAALERFQEEKRRFGLVIADPPAFIKTKKDVGAGIKGYKKLARLSATAVEPQGFLLIASCSHNMHEDRFVEETSRGIGEAGRSPRLIYRAGAGPDHPVHPFMPETAYLKALVFQLD
ncbi:MAG: class I SAM-dependent rRNA methyltransferase [Rhodospirillales bacterium]|nr:class I SAM-dependent rRNA methyltransferase [Rhodospirillales bacterium]